MGIDLKAGGRIVNKSKKESRTLNVYLRLLIKVKIKFNSYIHSYQEELRPNLMKLFLKDLNNQESNVILCLYPK